MQYCSLQNRTLLLSPVTSTAGYCFFFGSIPSFFLELFLHWSPVVYWVPTDLGSCSFSVLSFCLFILFMGFSRQEYWSGLSFPSPVDHVLSDLSTMTCLLVVQIFTIVESFQICLLIIVECPVYVSLQFLSYSLFCLGVTTLAFFLFPLAIWYFSIPSLSVCLCL